MDRLRSKVSLTTTQGCDCNARFNTMNTPEQTPAQLVQSHIDEIIRLAPVEPVPAYIMGALEYTLETIIGRSPEARQWIENRISYAQKQPTPTRTDTELQASSLSQLRPIADAMKTYPYHTPEGIIQLVEQREYDELAELALKLANLRAEDMATIKDQNAMIRTLGNALALITEEYEDRRFQFGDEYLWQKHEGVNPLPTAFAALDAYELLKQEQP